MLKSYLRIAASILARNKVYTAINVLGLALGVCGCIVIWLVGSYEMGFDRFHPDGDRIYRVVQGGKPAPDKDPNVIPPMPEAMRAGCSRRSGGEARSASERCWGLRRRILL